ncbi:unnamed protein product [Calicophoron daubneyi]|uniref:PDZ domain-containing protein n=1 Tax=Calicophoron daubneyi TaxID=300641 RepID=A0AAV2T8J9_CALDB
MTDVPETEVARVRLCHLRIWRNFKGYGFSLRSEPLLDEQIIENIEEGSPAKFGGLHDGDILLKVNGRSVAKLPHKDIVEMIKGKREEVRLLVVRPDVYETIKGADSPAFIAEREATRCETPIEASIFGSASSLNEAERHLVRADTETINQILAKHHRKIRSKYGHINHGMTHEVNDGIKG